MLESLFSGLYAALYGNLALAVIASFAWGVASVLLSPCHLSGIPLMVAFISGKKVLPIRKAFRLSLIFAIGILLSIALMGLITALLGRMIGDLGRHANLIFGIALCMGGILLMDVLPLGSFSWLGRVHIDGSRVWAVLLIGLLFGLALGPCTFAFMAPVLTLVFSLVETKLFLAIAVLFAYAAGHCVVIVFAGTSVNRVQKLLKWNENTKRLLMLKRACAALVVVAGVYLMFK